MSNRRAGLQERPKRSARVLICSRYTLFRDGIKALLEHSAGIEVVGEAGTAGKAIRLTQELEPDVVLLDAAASGLSASAATRRIKELSPGVTVLILSLVDDENLVSLCLQAGASGCIPKDGHTRQLAGAIHMACRKRVRAA